MFARYLKSTSTERPYSQFVVKKSGHYVMFNMPDKSNIWDEITLRLKDAYISKEVFDKRLRPYQNEDVARIRERLALWDGCLIFNQQRTGKTPTTIVATATNQRRLIITPSSVLYKWRSELRIWDTPGRNYIIFDGNPKQRLKKLEENPTADLIMTPKMATLSVDILSKIKNLHYIIVDEAHILRNYSSQQSKAIFKLASKIPKRLSLTGTPTVNDQTDIFGQLKYIIPSIFTSYWDFCEAFCEPEYNFAVKGMVYKQFKPNVEHIFKNYLQYFSIHRTRKEVLPWIPSKTYSTISLPMSETQQKLYLQMETLFMTETPLSQDLIIAENTLSQIMKLRQICLSPQLLEVSKKSSESQKIEKQCVDLSNQSDKLDLLKESATKIEWLNEYIQAHPEEKILIFSNFSSLLHSLSTMFKNSCVITGRTSHEQILQHVESFQSSSSTNLLLLNTTKCKEGLTLDQADTIIFLDRLYSPAMNEQAEDRFIPTTEDLKDKKLQIIDLVMENSIEEIIMEVLSSKKELTDLINTYKTYADFKEAYRNGEFR